jgi:8-oxo-dGTP pyrophosphatase MutT (NUDIX family)
MALPGGRRQPDESPLDTAIRETREEVAIDLLAHGMLIGRLDEVRPSGGPRIAVSPFVFAANENVAAVADPREVASIIWIPVTHLSDPASAAHHLHRLPDGGTHQFPALSYNGQIIWGLTYRVLTQFLGVVRAAGREEFG